MKRTTAARTAIPLATAGTALALTLAGCSGGDTGSVSATASTMTAAGVTGGPAPRVVTPGEKPDYLGAVTKTYYDGVSDDLLTGGLGKTGLGGAAPPVANPIAPTAAELRRLAIYNNYRAVLDPAPGGGYGTLYGPNIDTEGHDTLGEGKIAGTEYLAYVDDGSGRQNVTVMVQVPDGFDPANACIVTGTSSGSRGVYGAIGSSGEWGLKHRCAVAYTDKGSGNGVHDLHSNTVSLQDGVRADATVAGRASNFTAPISETERIAFDAANPGRFAVKHAHSQQNPEKDWGRMTLQSVEFAFYVLNQQFAGYGRKLMPQNTIVIASSISNGAGASLLAAEQDRTGLIDGVAVSEPNIQLPPDDRLRVTRGARTWQGTGRPLYDYFTTANLLMPCAALAVNAAAPAPFSTLSPALAANRCAALQANGLVSGATVAEQAASARDALLAIGYQAESEDLFSSMYAFAVPAIAMTYSNAYGHFSVLDNLCGFSFGGPSGANIAQSFGTGNGIPPSAGIAILNNNNPGGPVSDPLSTSPSTGRMDYNFDGAFCQRKLWTDAAPDALRVQAGVREVLGSADLHGKPALIVHGRSDTLIPVPFSSRPYFGENRIVEGGKSRLSYIEVTNAQHFDAFLGFPGFGNRYVPLHVYFNRAMDLMYAHLTQGAPLPGSQVVRTVPRAMAGGVVAPITDANVPPIRMDPPAADRITFANDTVTVPD